MFKPSHQQAVLGLITSKSGELGNTDAVLTRLDQVTRYAYYFIMNGLRFNLIGFS